MNILNWCFNQQTPSNPKYDTLLYQLYTAFTFLLLSTSLGILITYLFEEQFPEIKGNFPVEIRVCVGGFMLVYYFVLLGSRLICNGKSQLYDVCWACNQTILYFCIGLFWNKPVMVGAALIVILIDQMNWYVDCIGLILFKKLPVGVMKYLFWKETTLMSKITCTHHLWFIPLIMYTIAQGQGCQILTLYAYWMQFSWLCIFTIFARMLLPKEMMIKGRMIYQNINCSYECTKGVTIKYMHLLDNYPFIIFGPWQMINWNAINFIYYMIVRWLFNLVNIDTIQK